MKMVAVDQGIAEIRWMWLPTFIGQNLNLMGKLDREMQDRYLGRKATDALVAEMHEFVLMKVCDAYPMKGLRSYLEAIEGVEG